MFGKFISGYVTQTGRIILRPIDVLQKPFCSKFPWSFVCASMNSSPSAKYDYSKKKCIPQPGSLWANELYTLITHGQEGSYEILSVLWSEYVKFGQKLVRKSLLCRSTCSVTRKTLSLHLSLDGLEYDWHVMIEQPTSNNNNFNLCHASSLLCWNSLELWMAKHGSFSFYLRLSTSWLLSPNYCRIKRINDLRWFLMSLNYRFPAPQLPMPFTCRLIIASYLAHL